MKNENKINLEKQKQERKKKKQRLHGSAWHPTPRDKTVGVTSLLYSQFFVTMNPSRVYTRARVSPTWAYNILGLLGHYIYINSISLTIYIATSETRGFFSFSLQLPISL